MNALARKLAALIAAQGPISVAHYMEMANRTYYAARDPFGAEGDFITAPEISQMFGELIGLWIAQCWIDQGKPSPARLTELGPGRGTLMADALRAIAQAVPEFLSGLEIVLVENSPALREIQRKTLSPILPKVVLRWADAVEDAQDDRPLYLIANEFFDALPIAQYVKTQRGWNERMIARAPDAPFAFVLSPIPSAIPDPDARKPAEPGCLYEVSPASLALARHIAETIVRQAGAALIVDYGYGPGAGFGDTLQAAAKHRPVPVLENPGECDLTAHVDFAALAAAARSAGAVAHGPAEQGRFLAALGIAQRAHRLAQKDPAIESQLARLIHPEQMGSLFKVLAIVPPNAPAPPGF